MLIYKLFQFCFVFFASAAAALAADATFHNSARGQGSCTALKASASGNSNLSLSAGSAHGSTSIMNVHASGNTDVNAAADSFGRGSLAKTNIDVRASSGGCIKTNSFNQVYHGQSVNEVEAVATQRGAVIVEQVSTVNRGLGINSARGTSVGGLTKLVNTLIADKSQGRIGSQGSSFGSDAKTELEILADLRCSKGGGQLVGSATGHASAQGLSVIQNDQIHTETKTATRNCRSRASVDGNLFAN